METINSSSEVGEQENTSTPSILPAEAESPAWELVDIGRYRPRRIRGSNRGRELG